MPAINLSPNFKTSTGYNQRPLERPLTEQSTKVTLSMVALVAQQEAERRAASDRANKRQVIADNQQEPPMTNPTTDSPLEAAFITGHVARTYRDTAEAAAALAALKIDRPINENTALAIDQVMNTLKEKRNTVAFSILSMNIEQPDSELSNAHYMVRATVGLSEYIPAYQEVAEKFIENLLINIGITYFKHTVKVEIFSKTEPV